MKSSSAFCSSCVNWYTFPGIVEGAFSFSSIAWSQIHDSGKHCATSSLKTWECCWYLAGISPLPFCDPTCSTNFDVSVCFFDVLGLLLLSVFVQHTGIHWLVHRGALLCTFLWVWCYICWCEPSSFLGHVWWVAVGQPQSILEPSQCLVEWLQTMDILRWVSGCLCQWGRSVA